MNTLDAIFSRASVRAFTDEPISDATLQTLLRAAASGPSCVNARDWAFVVVRDRDTLCKMADANGAPANPLRQAGAAVLICGDTARSFPPAPDYWVIDGAIAGQNLVLAATELGLGSVWLGTWPEMDRVARQQKLFGLPDTVIPHSILALGYAQSPAAPKEKPLPAEQIHWEKW